MRQLRTALAGQSRKLAALAALGLVNAMCILILNRGYAGMFNAALAGQSGGIAAEAAGLAAVAIVCAAVNLCENIMYGRIAEATGHRLRMRAARAAVGAESAALSARHSGDALTRVHQDLKQAVEWLSAQFCPAVVEAMVLLAVLTAMVLTDWRLTLAAFAAVPFVTLYAWKASKPIRRTANDRQEAFAAANVLVKSALDAFPIVKVFDMPALLMRKYGGAVDESVRLAVKANGVERLLMSINGLSSLIPLGVLLGLGGAMVIRGDMSAGVLLAIINLSNFVSSPIMNLPGRISGARAFAANIDRAAEQGELPQEAQRSANGRIADTDTGNAISLDNVTLRYGEDRPALHNATISVKTGGRAAIVGPSGCGKSTVIKLIAALYMPQQGHVRVLGRDTRRWDLHELRENIAVVMQDAFLFPGSIRENITCGRDAPEERLLDACRAAGLTDFVATLPDGLDTAVGERGERLSGGQRQRVAIARAILRDAPVLLLDEATSALDARTERGVQDALEALMAGRTTLVVTHRLSSVRGADRIYCMDAGRVVEAGTHAELMALGGFYAGLVRVQEGGGPSDPERGGTA